MFCTILFSTAATTLVYSPISCLNCLFFSILHLSSSSSTLLLQLFFQSVNAIMLLSPLKFSRGSAFSSSKGNLLNLAYKFSHNQANADFSYNSILSLSLLNHLHIPEPAIRIQHLDLSSDYFLCLQYPLLLLSVSVHSHSADTWRASLLLLRLSSISSIF